MRKRLVLVAVLALGASGALAQKVKTRKEKEAEAAAAAAVEAKKGKGKGKGADQPTAPAQVPTPKATPQSPPPVKPATKPTTPAAKVVAPTPAVKPAVAAPAPAAPPPMAEPMNDTTPPANDLPSLVTKHAGAQVTVREEKDRAWIGSFSGTGTRDLAILVTAHGKAAELPPKVKVDYAYPQDGEPEKGRLGDDAKEAGQDAKTFLPISLLFMHGGKGVAHGSGMVRLLVNVQRAGLSGEIQPGTFKRMPANADMKRIGCDFDALRVISESSASLYVCLVKGQYEILHDPDDAP